MCYTFEKNYGKDDLMFCPECGKEISGGAKFCNYCGAPIPESGPRHAREDYGDPSAYPNREYDESTRVYRPDDLPPEEPTKLYDLQNFEGYGEPVPPEEDYPYDDREFIDDSYDNYSDGEDDRTFMDKMDEKFRRDDDMPKKRKNKAWIWALVVVAILVVAGVVTVVAITSGNAKKNNTAPTTATVAATVKPTVKATEAPKPTKAPATQPPAPTEAPAPTNPPATEAPQIITEPPATQPPAPTQAPATAAPEPEAPTQSEG